MATTPPLPQYHERQTLTRAEMDDAWNLTPRQQRGEHYRCLTLRGVAFVYNPSDTLWHRQEPAREEAPATRAVVSETAPVTLDSRIFRTTGGPVNWTYSIERDILFDTPFITQRPQTPSELEQRLEQAVAQLREAQARGSSLQVLNATRTVNALRSMIANQTQTN